MPGLQGKPLPQVSEQDVNELLKPLVQVSSATMEARPPSALLVHVNERVPVALVKQGDSYLLVDVDGVQLGATTGPGYCGTAADRCWRCRDHQTRSCSRQSLPCWAPCLQMSWPECLRFCSISRRR